MVKLFLQSIAIAPTTTASRCSSWFLSHSLKRCRSISSTTITLPKASKIKSASAQMSSTTQFTFGPYKIDAKEVFYSTPLSYAMVNLRPLLPDLGWIVYEHSDAASLAYVLRTHEHVLVCSRREAKRFADLTADETTDLWLTAQKVGKQLESYHKGSSTTFAIQVSAVSSGLLISYQLLVCLDLDVKYDGPEAGQTVPHVHIHVLPRKAGDFEKNDEIYDAIEVKEKELQQKLDLDKERKDRSLEEMNQEADQYRSLFL
ncbi:Bifunctional bis(5'-adenosyl)-triphosphatase/adenylylsulfatase FHIT [Citrus sinensis]|nr:Bifunctional bis(5'-adenosyl)-triphosphatase/adenylylsulfatase FHIT [Citrus sinensis]